MFHHTGHFGSSPPLPRVHFAYANGSPILNAKYARRKYGRSAQSGRMTSPIWSSPRPKWSNRTLRDRSRSTSCSAFHDGAESRGASKSFSIHAEYRFSVARFHVLRTGQTLPCVACGRGGLRSLTAISRVIVLHSAGARSRASFACHVPAAGDATSANQKYGGPPCRSRDLAATLPLGAISESSPSSGFSAAKMTRNGAPFHGAIGEGRTASSAASSQTPGRPWAGESATENRMAKNAPAISNDAVAAAANGRAGTIEPPPGLLLGYWKPLAESWRSTSLPGSIDQAIVADSRAQGLISRDDLALAAVHGWLGRERCRQAPQQDRGVARLDGVLAPPPRLRALHANEAEPRERLGQASVHMGNEQRQLGHLGSQLPFGDDVVAVGC